MSKRSEVFALAHSSPSQPNSKQRPNWEFAVGPQGSRPQFLLLGRTARPYQVGPHMLHSWAFFGPYMQPTKEKTMVFLTPHKRG